MKKFSSKKKLIILLCAILLLLNHQRSGILEVSLQHPAPSTRTVTSQETMKRRVDKLNRFCSQHTDLKNGNVSEKVRSRIRFVPQWNLWYCENYKVYLLHATMQLFISLNIGKDTELYGTFTFKITQPSIYFISLQIASGSLASSLIELAGFQADNSLNPIHKFADILFPFAPPRPPPLLSHPLVLSQTKIDVGEKKKKKRTPINQTEASEAEAEAGQQLNSGLRSSQKKEEIIRLVVVRNPAQRIFSAWKVIDVVLYSYVIPVSYTHLTLPTNREV